MAKRTSETLYKRSNKFESFLKKNLTEDIFDSVRAYESCIVCSERENKAFKFVVITDESIYLTENPPKSIYEAISFRDVTTVQLVNDLPEFLSGREQENTQHIAVKYKTEVLQKNKKLTLKRNGVQTGRKSPRRDLSESPESSTANMKNIRNVGSTPLKKSLSEGAGDEAMLKSSSHDDLQEIMKGGDTDNDDTDSINSGSLSQSMPSQLLQKLGLDNGRARSKSPRGGRSPRGDVINRIRHTSNSSSDGGLGPTRPLPKLNTSKSDQCLSDSESPREKAGAFRSSSRLTSMTEDLGISIDESGVSHRGSEGRSSVTSGGRISRNNSDASSGIPALRLNLDGNNLSLEDETFENSDNNNITYREAVLHLYMLSTDSPMMILIKSAWNNYVIRSTLQLDPAYIEKISPSPRRAKMDSEKVTLLYNQLKRELLAATNMETCFRLMFELQSAAEKNFYLKKLFWKEAGVDSHSPDMFSLVISKLQKYLPKSKANNLNSEKGRTQRADEFELVIVLVETLALMFRETEILPSRLHCLKANKGKAALDLLIVLTCFPEVPQKYVPPSSKAAVLLNTSQADQWKCLTDAEIAKLMAEFSSMATVILFELILIAEQGNWGDTEGSFFNVCWLVKVLEELRTTIKFVEGVVGRAMRLIAPGKHIELSPTQAVLVFQEFYVLLAFTKYSLSIEAHIRNNFTEEFKYFIQAPILAEKLPASYPITAWTINLIESVTSRILQKSVKLNIGHKKVQ